MTSASTVRTNAPYSFAAVNTTAITVRMQSNIFRNRVCTKQPSTVQNTGSTQEVDRHRLSFMSSDHTILDSTQCGCSRRHQVVEKAVYYVCDDDDDDHDDENKPNCNKPGTISVFRFLAIFSGFKPSVLFLSTSTAWFSDASNYSSTA